MYFIITHSIAASEKSNVTDICLSPVMDVYFIKDNFIRYRWWNLAHNLDSHCEMYIVS